MSKTKTNPNQDKVLSYLKTHPGSSATEISSGTKLKQKEVAKIMTALKKDNVVRVKPRLGHESDQAKKDDRKQNDENADAKIKNQKMVLDFILKNPATAAKMCKSLKLDRIVVINTLGQLIKEKKIELKPNGSEKIYVTVNTNPTEPKIEKKPLPSVKENTGTSPKKKTTGRNHDKYVFMGKEYSKGRLCVALVAQVIKDHRPKNYDALMKIFDEQVIRPYGYGFIRPASEAKKINAEQSGNRTRFFTESSDLLRMPDKKFVSVTNQISGDILDRILGIVKRFKYSVKVKSK